MRRALFSICWFAGGVAGCGVDTAQTAYLPSPPFDCAEPATSADFPAQRAFGEGETRAQLAWVDGDYGPGEGPGLYVVARDVFRVFLNGRLIHEGSAARQPTFVPLTLLPGDNALGIVVSAGRGPAALLAQLDELERSYQSDDGWRVSAAPPEGWSDAHYDDSAWQAATDLGALGSAPGCDPGQTFPADTGAHWIGSRPPAPTLAFRLRIPIRPLGFAAGTTGGGDAAPQVAQDPDDLATLLSGDEPAVVLLGEGAMDLRPSDSDVQQQHVCPEPCSEDPTKTSLTVLVGDATCSTEQIVVSRNDRRIAIGSNKTLVGLGRGAQLRGASFSLDRSRNVILRNIVAYDVNRDLIEAGDGVDLQQSDGVWIDHDTFRWISDGFTDARTGTSNVTISWVHYDGRNEGVCTERHPRASQFSSTTITLHHNLWEHVLKRAPLADHPESRVHLFDNVITDDPDYAVGAACGAELLLEANTFEDVRHPTEKTTCPGTGDELGAIDAVAGTNLYRGDIGSHRAGTKDIAEPHDSVFTPGYSYTTERAADAWPTVLTRAGAGGPWALPLSLD